MDRKLAAKANRMSHFPVELLSSIFTYLVDDHPTLAQCASVSRAFRAEARPWLYRQLDLFGSRLFPCLTHLATDSQGASYIRRLAFNQDGLTPTLDDWIAVRNACRGMTNLRVLEMKGVSKQAIWAFEFPSQQLHTVFLKCGWADALEDWLHERPHITELHYFIQEGPGYGLDIPLETLPNLRVLHGRIQYYCDTHVSVCSFIRGRPLQEIRLQQKGDEERKIRGDADELLRACMGAKGPLRRLVADVEQTALLRSFGETFASIEELVLLVTDEEDANREALNLALSRFPHLRLIEMQYNRDLDLESSDGDGHLQLPSELDPPEPLLESDSNPLPFHIDSSHSVSDSSRRILVEMQSSGRLARHPNIESIEFKGPESWRWESGSDANEENGFVLPLDLNARF